MTDFRAIETAAPLRLRSPLTQRHMAVGNYVLADGLVEAIDVAMMLGTPLLLTGEPGTGKTQAAIWLAETLGVGPALRYDVKSMSTGSELLYSFDEVARFRDSSRSEVKPLVEYLRLNALGEAIVRAAGGDALLCDRFGNPLTGGALEINAHVMERAFGPGVKKDASVSLLLPDDKSFARAAPEHRVVLIDELDKAPRDTPNDLLFEVERMAFAIPELGVMVRADSGLRPVVVLTSNSEKELPGPFLRRCVFFDIPSPSPETLQKIATTAILELQGGGALLDTALQLFVAIQKERDLSKKPATAEFLAWLDILIHREGLDAGASLIDLYRSDPARIEKTLCAVAKSRDDLKLAKGAVERLARA